METILEKISSYNIFNNVIPGAIFCFFCKSYLNMDISGEGALYNLCLFYFWGMVISRIGSLLVESISIRLKIVKYAPYHDYLIASNKNESIKTQLEVNNMFRTIASVFLCLIFLEGLAYINNKMMDLIDMKFNFSFTLTLFFFLIFIIMMFAYRKQTSYIVKKVNFEIYQSSISEG